MVPIVSSCYLFWIQAYSSVCPYWVGSDVLCRLLLPLYSLVCFPVVVFSGYVAVSPTSGMKK